MQAYTQVVLGVLITLVFSLGAGCFGYVLIKHFLTDLDPALRFGVSGLTGLAAIGLLTLFIGLVPGGLGALGLTIVCLVAASAGVYRLIKQPPTRWIKPAVPKGPLLLFPVAVGLAQLYSLIGVLAPADTFEWDSLAYHLAVPKLWLHAEQIQPISFIHHSNFPFSIDNLYIWGLTWGGESGAKAFTFAFAIFGVLAVFGFARQRYGEVAAWWAALVWTTVPVVLWLSGTAYIDVQNGLFAGLGILFAADFLDTRTKDRLWIAAVLLGFAAGSKYTGLQTIFASSLIVLALRSKSSFGSKFKAAAAMSAVAVAIAAPWYIKNTLWAGNPVYPFFYEKLGGKNWSDYNAKIYSNEQQTFGAARATETPDHPYTSGHIEPLRLGHSLLGIAYQPGRYINPAPTQNMGVPAGAIGFVVIGGMLAWLISGRLRKFETATAAMVGISLLMWFVLSEQSRYIIALAVPMAALSGGAITRLKVGPVLACGAVLQAGYSFWILHVERLQPQMQVVLGKVSPDDYRSGTIGFYAPAQYLNQTVKSGRVALYDEVFGFLLDVPYFWANPGHSTEMGYDRMQTADDLVAAFKRENITYVYLNLSIYPQDDPGFVEWTRAMGFGTNPEPYSSDRRSALMNDMGWRWKVLLAEAISHKKLVLEKNFGPRLVFRVAA